MASEDYMSPDYNDYKTSSEKETKVESPTKGISPSKQEQPDSQSPSILNLIVPDMGALDRQRFGDSSSSAVIEGEA